MGIESFFRTFLALIAVFLPLYLVRLSLFGIPTNVLEACIVIAFVIGILTPPLRKSWMPAIRTIPLPLKIFGVMFLGAAITSTYISPHFETSFGILKGWIIIPMLYAFLLYAEIQRIPGNKNSYISRIENHIILSGVIVSLLGISQFGTLDRLKGPYDVANSLALYIAPLIVLAVLRSLHTKLSQKSGYKVYAYAALCMFIALLGTQSLGGMVAVIVTLLIYLALDPKVFLLIRSSISTPVVMLLLVLISVAGFMGSNKIQYLLQPHSSAYVRLQLWSISGELIKEYPFLGIGLGVFEPFYQRKLHERFTEVGKQESLEGPNTLPEFVFRDPHNWLLSFWLNTGLCGLLAFASLNLWLLYKNFKFLIVNNHLLPLVAILLIGLVDTVYWKNDLAALYWILVGMGIFHNVVFTKDHPMRQVSQ